jgi:hypothetical protein
MEQMVIVLIPAALAIVLYLFTTTSVQLFRDRDRGSILHVDFYFIWCFCAANLRFLLHVAPVCSHILKTTWLILRTEVAIYKWCKFYNKKILTL